MRRDIVRILLRPFDRRPTEAPSSRVATRDDIYYCYRLLLNRQPDAEGWRFYTDLVDKAELSVERLVGSFVDSHEYRTRRREEHRTLPILIDGVTLHVRADDREVGGGLAESREYEPHVTSELKQVLRDGLVFVDIGANVGYFTMLAASLVGAAGKVVAFELNPDNCALIRLSVEANGFRNVVLHPFAVGDTEQKFALDITGSNGALREERRTGDVVVHSIVLDVCLADEPRIDVIKIHIEGFEGRALRGMVRTIVRHRPVLFTEFSLNDLVRRSLIDPLAYLTQVAEFGYDLFLLPMGSRRGPVPHTPAEIVQAYSRARTSHLDVVAYPR